MADWRTRLVMGAVVVVVSAGGWAWHERDERLRAEGRAEVAEVAAAALADTLAVARERVRVDSARVEAARAERDQVAEDARQRIDSLRVSRPQLIDTLLVEAGPDSTVVREAVERVAASYEAEVSALTLATAAAAATIAAQDALIDSLRDEIRVRAELETRLRQQLDGARATRPGWIERHTERLAWAAVGLASGWALAETLR